MSIIHKFTGDPENFGWQNVEGVVPSEAGVEATTMHILLGEKEGAPNFITRYFRVEPHGFTPQHQHPHEHEVIILHGKGQIQIGDKIQEVFPHDVALVSGGDLHQIKNIGDEPLGFLCIIPKI